MNIQVIKRDKTVEEYQENKIEKVVLAAGLNLKQAKLLTANINGWIKKNSFLKVSSLEIRDKVIEELKKTGGTEKNNHQTNTRRYRICRYQTKNKKRSDH